MKVCKELGGVKFGNGPVLCTYKLKTEPFNKWLKENYPKEKGQIREAVTILCCLDKEEEHRINIRV